MKHRGTKVVAVAGVALACLAAAVASAAVPATPAAGTIETIAGGGAQLADGVPATEASLTYLTGIAVNRDGDVFVSDATNCAIRKISHGIITRVAGTGVCDYGGVISDVGDGGPALNATFHWPQGLALDSAGNLYVADSDHCEVRKLDFGTGIISRFAGQGPGHCWVGPTGDGGPATEAILDRPAALAIDRFDNVYITENLTCRLRKVSAGVISTVAGPTVAGYASDCSFAGDGGPATDARLNAPTGIAVDADGVLYIADLCRIRRIADGIITTIAGSGACATSPDGPAVSVALNYPYDVAADNAGGVLISDSYACMLRRLYDGMITTIAGAPLIVNDSITPVCGHTGDGGSATSAEIGWPSGVAVDGTGNAYINELSATEPGTSTVRVVYGVAPPPPAPTPTPTIDPAIDTDGDGCADAKELQLVPPTDPTNAWDFYSVPAPALFGSPNPTSTIRDSVVRASDAQSVFAYFKKNAQTGSLEYEQDLNANGVKDGLEYDRSFAGPGKSGPPDGVVGAIEAQLAFAQFKFGYRC